MIAMREYRKLTSPSDDLHENNLSKQAKNCVSDQSACRTSPAGHSSDPNRRVETAVVPRHAMSNRARPQYYDVVRAAHEANQQSGTAEPRHEDRSGEALIVSEISDKGFHHTANNHLGPQITDF